MGETLLGGAITAGTATAIGSLPHRDAHAAAALTLRCLPELPAIPQLPLRSKREGIVAQWAGAVPGIQVRDDGTIELTAAVDPLGRLKTLFDDSSHAGLLTFLEVAAQQPRPPKQVKVQLAGPLTLGVAFVEAGMDAAVAFPLGARVARAWAAAIAELVSARLPGAGLVCFFDEPALVLWRGAEGPLDREVATDLLSTALAACAGVSGCPRVRQRRPAPRARRRTAGRALRRRRARSRRRHRAFAVPGRRRLGCVGCDSHPPPGRRTAATVVEGAARRVVRVDAARVRPRPARAARRSSRRRAVSRATE